MKIFLLEDDFSLNESITEMLENEGYIVSSFYDGIKALDNISNDFGLYILDINAPKLDGLNLLEHIKNINKNANVLMISANINIDTIKNAYSKGCDDYLKKPFDIQELMLKINKYCKKSADIAYLGEKTYFDNFEQKLSIENNEIELTKYEKLFLILLIKNRGSKITYTQIEDFVYNGESKTTNAIRSLVKRLRKKIPKDFILNSQDEGYFIK